MSQENESNFDLVRISYAKRVVNICANTIRAYHEQGLPLYSSGGATFFSKRELEAFLRKDVLKPGKVKKYSKQ